MLKLDKRANSAKSISKIIKTPEKKIQAIIDKMKENGTLKEANSKLIILK